MIKNHAGKEKNSFILEVLWMKQTAGCKGDQKQAKNRDNIE